MTLQTTTHPSNAIPALETSAATAAVFIIAIRYRFSPDIPIGFLLAACLIPVTARYVTRYRGAAIITGLCIVSAVSGLLLTMSHSALGDVSKSLAVIQTVRILQLVPVLGALLWARALLGLPRLVLTFGLGSLASLMVSGVNIDNLWKFSFSVPTTLILLSLTHVATHRWRQMLVALTLVAISVLNDSRSAAGLLLMAAALTVTQRRVEGADRVASRLRSWVAVGRVAMIGVGSYLVVQAAILEGILGDAARTRTLAQISQSGSAIVGGRPEMGAALSLIRDRPWGYGSGTLPTYDHIMLGKAGMKPLGYDPNNGYVENYMFGDGFEVHSMLGDFWILFGLAGASLAVVSLIFALYGLGDSLSRGTAMTVAIFLILRLTWDFAFSPFASTMVLMPLTLAVALPALPDASVPRQALPPGSG